MTRRRFAVLASAAALAAAAAVLPLRAAQTRDAARAPVVAGTAALAGRILTAGPQPQPLRRAQVTVQSTDGRFSRMTMTDAEGRFAIDGLPGGRYNLTAGKPGYVRMTFGANSPERPGTAIALAEGETRADVLVRVPRGAVVAGRILDEFGQPAPNVLVRVHQYRTIAGQRSLVPVGSVNEVTDDRGMYRIYGLPAGDTVVSAAPRQTVAGDIRQIDAADLEAAQQALRQSASARLAQPAGGGGGAAAGVAGGGVAGGGVAGGGVPATPMAKSQDALEREGRTVGFATVYYPGTTIAADAATIPLAMGEERTGIDFQLQLVRTARVEGVVSVPPGVPPQSVQILLVARVPAGPVISVTPTSLNRATVGPDGQFRFTGVSPGDYTLSARATARPAGAPDAGRGGRGDVVAVTGATRAGGPAGPGGQTYWAETDLTVSGQPITDLSLALQPGMTLTGRIVVEASTLTPPEDLSRIRVSLGPAPNPAGGLVVAISMGASGSQVEADGRFRVDGVTPGRYRLAAAPPGPGWTLKSAVIGGVDTQDLPVEIRPNQDLSGAVITFTDRTQEVSGQLQDAAGRPAPEFTILVFPTDPRYWLPGRRLRSIRPGTDGRFTFAGLPAGEYYLAAAIDVAPGETTDPAFLEQIAPAAYRFTLGEGERKVQDLRIAGGDG